MKFTIRADYLRAVHANVLPRDEVTRPQLACYRLDPAGATLTGSDGHALVQAPVSVLVEKDMATELRLLSQVMRIHANAVLVEFTESEDGTYWRVQQTSKSGKVLADEAVQVHTELSYPKLDSIIPKESTLQRMPDGPVAFNPALMARTSEPLDDYADLYFAPDRGPMVLKLPNHPEVLCLVMGCRPNDKEL